MSFYDFLYQAQIHFRNPITHFFASISDYLAQPFLYSLILSQRPIGEALASSYSLVYVGLFVILVQAFPGLLQNSVVYSISYFV